MWTDYHRGAGDANHSSGVGDVHALPSALAKTNREMLTLLAYVDVASFFIALLYADNIKYGPNPKTKIKPLDFTRPSWILPYLSSSNHEFTQ